ncbi:exosporium leader peptide-containing protein [Bacillus mycoides]|nr:exosporium leader peptide-containing protein [Bacillus mycoides]
MCVFRGGYIERKNKWYGLNSNVNLSASSFDPNLVGPTLPPISPISVPTGPTGATGITGPTGPGPTVSLKFLYVANFNENTVEIYDIFNPIFPVRIGEFNGGNLANPAGLAITGTLFM